MSWAQDASACPISIGSDATILRDGKPYHAIGVNYFDCFLRLLKNPNDPSCEAGFKILADHHIPFVRFCATGFWPTDLKLYQTNHAEYFRRLDLVVRSAEKYNIGLVPSLFWNFSCVPDLVGEPMDQWGNPRSKTMNWMREYVRAVVIRYRNSRAIWAWEFGNEFNLAASLPNAKEHLPWIHPTLGTPSSRSERDALSFPMVRIAAAEFAKAVRDYDPWRLIVSGDSSPRLSAWHNEHDNDWNKDTREQFQEMLEKGNPDPINGISLHVYEDDDQRLEWAVEVSKRMNKPLFVGEFGAEGTSPEQMARFHRLLKAIVDFQIPLAAVWVFDLNSQPDCTIFPGTPRSYQLEEIGSWDQTHVQP